jgi:hypothetical protein
MADIPPGYAPFTGEPDKPPPMPPGYEPFTGQPDAPDGNYRGSILPYSTDAQGNLNWMDTGIPLAGVASGGAAGFDENAAPKTLKLPFDFTAGIPGAIWDAFKLPGDVATGQQPTPYSGGPGQPDSNLLARTFNLATTINPAPVGRGVPLEAPSARSLADTANTQYDAFRNSGLQVTGTGVSRTITDLRGDLRTKGLILDPKDPVNLALDDFANSSNGPYVTSPGVYGAVGLDAARQRFAKLASGDTPSAQAAGAAVKAIDDYTTNIPLNPQHLAPGNTADAAAAIKNLQDARANYGAAKRSDALTGSLNDYANTGILDQAVGRASTRPPGAADLDAMVRSRIATFMQNPDNLRGFSPSEIDLLNGVKNGTVSQNMLGIGQRLLGAGHGSAGMGAGFALYEGLSHLMANHPAIGTAVGIGTALANPVLKSIEGRLAGGGMRTVDETVRGRSPLYQGQTTVGSPTPNPAINWNWRTVPPGLLNP